MTAVIAIAVIIGAAIGLIAAIVFYFVTAEGPDTAEHPDRSRQLESGGSWFCAQCCANEGDPHLEWCTYGDGALEVAEAAGVVAGSDLDWQLDLARIYRDYDAYRAEHRLPGESR
jgi:hypothetical protein